MAIRTTAEAVGQIIAVNASISLTSFIEAASQLVTDNCDGTETQLELVERWLSAHMYAMRDPRRTSDGAGGISASYQGTVGLGFDLTHYGQMAMRFDASGGLARLNEQAKSGSTKTPNVSWLGTARI